MFSDHLKKIDEAPYKTLLWVAAGMVFVCQLAAFAFVADGQVTKAKMRDFQRKAEMQAIAQCMENSPGPARQSCFQQARVVAGAVVQPASGGEETAQVAGSSGSGSSGGMMAIGGGSATVSSMLPTQPAQGFMSASFIR